MWWAFFSIKALHMQSEAAVHCKGPQKLFGEAGIISPDHRLRHISVKDQEGPVRKVQNREAQGLVHWDTGGGEAAEPLPIPQGPVQSLAKDDARVLHRWWPSTSRSPRPLFSAPVRRKKRRL